MLVAAAILAAAPNVVFICVDATRPDHLGVYGYPRRTSAELDAFSREAAVFTDAVSTSAWTPPAVASALTGLYPTRHGLESHLFVLSKEVTTLPERLRARGYATRGVVSSPLLEGKLGYSRGFDSYDDSLGRDLLPRQVVAADKVADKAVAALSELRGSRFFLFLHFMDPHEDYAPPPPFVTLFVSEGMGPLERLVALYDGELAWTFRNVGRVLRALDELELAGRTAVFIFADHGEGFGEHGLKGHTCSLYEELIRIPLLLRAPGVVPCRLEAQVSLVDLTPTALDLCGAAEEIRGMDGRSLLPALGGDERELAALRSRTVFAKLSSKRRLACARRPPRKLIREMGPGYLHAFDLSKDPRELSPFPPQVDWRYEVLSNALDRWLTHSVYTVRSRWSRESLRRIKALGY